MFMKSAPEDFDPEKYPELACIQAILHGEDTTPEGKQALFSYTVATFVSFVTNGFGFSTEQANSLKNEGNQFFKEKKYEKAIICYTAALKKDCGDQEINTVLLTNRAAAQFHLGILSSSYFQNMCFFSSRAPYVAHIAT